MTDVHSRATRSIRTRIAIQSEPPAEFSLAAAPLTIPNLPPRHWRSRSELFSDAGDKLCRAESRGEPSDRHRPCRDFQPYPRRNCRVPLAAFQLVRLAKRFLVRRSRPRARLCSTAGAVVPPRIGAGNYRCYVLATYRQTSLTRSRKSRQRRRLAHPRKRNATATAGRRVSPESLHLFHESLQCGVDTYRPVLTEPTIELATANRHYILRRPADASVLLIQSTVRW